MRRKKAQTLLLIFLCGVWSVRAQNQDALQQLLQTEGLKQAAVGISVKSVSDGKKILDYQAEMALTPASVMKLLPTWLALQEKGPDFQFHTPVYYTGEVKEGVLAGDIIIKAQGDPALESKYFPQQSFLKVLVNGIKSKGIQNIQGRIIVEGVRKGTEIPGSWPWEDVSNYYAALYLPFNYRDNTYTLQFRSGEPGKPAELISVVPALPGVKIQSEVKAAGDHQDNAWIFGGPYSSVLCVKGTIPARRSAFKVKGAIHDPATVFTAEMVRELIRNGISIDQRTLAIKGEKGLITLHSPILAEIVFHTNKSSVNLFAEALGYLSARNEWAEKIKVALGQIGIDASGMILKDACGLSPMNAVPARLFTDLLVYTGQQKQDTFVRSLPVAGIDGGLAGYSYASPGLKNKLKAKTGSMSGVRCLAGYITRNNGEELAFTILVNHYTCTVAQLQEAMGKFLSSFL